jgi:hypothetical protein
MMLAKLLPQHLDNGYQGCSLGLWVFGLVTLVKSIQSVAIIFAGGVTAKGADGIPLDTFAPVDAQTVLSVFAQQSLWRLTFCLICFIVLLRYRSAVPLMFALFVANYLAGQLIFHVVPLPRIGTPPGPAVNLALFFLMVTGLVLSLWQRTREAKQ